MSTRTNPRKTPRPFGDFGQQTVVGLVEVNPEDTIRPYDRWGICLENHYVFASVFSENGDRDIVLRTLPREGLPLPSAQSNYHNRGSDRISPDPGKADASFRPLSRSLENGVAVIEGERSNGDKFLIRQSVDELHWEEPNISLHGRIVGPGVAFYGPLLVWEHWRGLGCGYHSLGYVVEGEVFGERVRGIGYIDCYYMPPGMTFATNPIMDSISIFWHNIGTIYEDGTAEVGVIGAGRDGFGFFWLNDRNGNIVCTNRVDPTFEYGEDGHVSRIVSSIDDGAQTWEFLPDARGRLFTKEGIAEEKAMGKTHREQCEGRARRVGDDRVATHWTAWNDSWVDNFRSDS